MVNTKKVKMDLVGLDGNAFALMGAFGAAARRQGWTSEEINAVITECTSGDYDHLLATLMDNTESPEDVEDDNEDDYEFSSVNGAEDDEV